MGLQNNMTTETEMYDINEDGVIDFADLSVLLGSDLYGATVYLIANCSI